MDAALADEPEAPAYTDAEGQEIAEHYGVDVSATVPDLECPECGGETDRSSGLCRDCEMDQ